LDRRRGARPNRRGHNHRLRLRVRRLRFLAAVRAPVSAADVTDHQTKIANHPMMIA
jgi:hypothetical protein